MLVEEHIRPLIKEELRYSIQSKRMAKGLPDIVSMDRKETVFDVSLLLPCSSTSCFYATHAMAHCLRLIQVNSEKQKEVPHAEIIHDRTLN